MVEALDGEPGVWLCQAERRADADLGEQVQWSLDDGHATGHASFLTPAAVRLAVAVMEQTEDRWRQAPATAAAHNL